MSQYIKDMEEMMKLGRKITDILTEKEYGNVGIPIMALEFAKNIYTNMCRRSIPEHQQESFEMMVRETASKIRIISDEIDSQI